MNYLTCTINDFPPEQFHRYLNMMEFAKRQRVSLMRFEMDQKRSVAGEYLARTLLSAQLQTAPDRICIKTLPSGKPYVSGARISFSISHSGDYALCAVSESETGADIEKIRKANLRVAKRVCSPKEYVYVSQKNTDHRFFQLWTLKEAYAKALGSGILSVAAKTDFSITDNTEFLETKACSFLLSYELPDYIIAICTVKQPPQRILSITGIV